tara:strand:+ start:3948 stop:4727 length:780 start_codon:yes stop_codon:yes gene_type:complete
MELITTAEFSANYKLNLKEHIETKGGSFQAKYISWAIAQKLLRERHPTLSVDFEKGEGGQPLHLLNDNIFLLPFLTDGEKRTPAIFFPVMDNKFNAITNPCATQVNRAFQRATAKVIAVYTGLGLSLFTNEDLEDLEDPTPRPVQTKAAPREIINKLSVQPKNYQAEKLDWEEMKIPFGKYDGKTLKEVATENPSYLEFMTGPKSKFEFKDYELEAAFKMAVEWAKTGVIEPGPTKVKLEDLPGKEVIDQKEDMDDVPF